MAAGPLLPPVARRTRATRASASSPSDSAALSFSLVLEPFAPFAPFAAPRTAHGAGSLLPGFSFPEEPGGGFGGLSPDGAALEAAVAAATRAAAGEVDA